MNSAVDRHCTLVDVFLLVDTVKYNPPAAVEAVPVLGQV